MQIELIGPNNDIVNVHFDPNNPNPKRPIRVTCSGDNPLLTDSPTRFSVVPSSPSFVIASSPLLAYQYFTENGFKAVGEEQIWLENGHW